VCVWGKGMHTLDVFPRPSRREHGQRCVHDPRANHRALFRSEPARNETAQMMRLQEHARAADELAELLSFGGHVGVEPDRDISVPRKRNMSDGRFETSRGECLLGVLARTHILTLCKGCT
jgi:hypothetical protein